MSEALAFICVLLWLYLVAGRGLVWLAHVRDAHGGSSDPSQWPAVVAVVPARNESDCIAESVQSLLRQDYAGPLSIVVVDDDSSDDTAEKAASQVAPDRQVTLVRGKAPPRGWAGKLWALKQGVDAAETLRPAYLLLTDADIVHAPDTLKWLVKQSSAGQFVLTSLMAKLRCESLAERSHVPAFIYFFQMLFPFSWVRRPASGVAAAAGGCMLVRADALARAGGIAGIRNSLIDDCSLAAKLKAVGPIWLGLTNRVRSIRPYDTLSDVKRMISRSAYAQLRYSPVLLAGTAVSMVITFIIPPLLAIFATGLPQLLGLLVWFAMALSYIPTLRFYRLSFLWSLALPAIASLYLYYTLDSAYQYLRGRGGQWKGRIHADAPGLQ